jgi:hypothetical protein
MVWLGTERPIPAVPRPKEPDPLLGCAYVEPVAEDTAIRRALPSPFVTYVGSHEGCGCGFNSSLPESEGIEEEAELAPLLDALREEEREEYFEERRSRERLHDLVVSALRDGPVVVHVCWAGDEAEPPWAEETVDASWLLERTAPLKEGVRYHVAAPG